MYFNKKKAARKANCFKCGPKLVKLQIQRGSPSLLCRLGRGPHTIHPKHGVFLIHAADVLGHCLSLHCQGGAQRVFTVIWHIGAIKLPLNCRNIANDSVVFLLSFR